MGAQSAHLAGAMKRRSADLLGRERGSFLARQFQLGRSSPLRADDEEASRSSWVRPALTVVRTASVSKALLDAFL